MFESSVKHSTSPNTNELLGKYSSNNLGEEDLAFDTLRKSIDFDNKEDSMLDLDSLEDSRSARSNRDDKDFGSLFDNAEEKETDNLFHFSGKKTIGAKNDELQGSTAGQENIPDRLLTLQKVKMVDFQLIFDSLI